MENNNRKFEEQEKLKAVMDEDIYLKTNLQTE